MSEITTTKAASGNLLITIILDKDQLDPLFGFSGDKRLLCLFYVHAYRFQHQQMNDYFFSQFLKPI